MASYADRQHYAVEGDLDSSGLVRPAIEQRRRQHGTPDPIAIAILPHGPYPWRDRAGDAGFEEKIRRCEVLRSPVARRLGVALLGRITSSTARSRRFAALFRRGNANR